MNKIEFLNVVDQAVHTDTRPEWLRDMVCRPNWLYYQAFIYLTKYVNPKLIVELGTQAGVGALHFRQGSSTAKIITVDIRPYPGEGKGLRDENNIESVICDSTEYAKQVKDKTVDILFCDANHTYESVIAEITAWMPKMAPNGILLFDDIWLLKNKPEDKGMCRAWEELSKKYGKETFEVMKLHPAVNFGIILL